MANLKVLVCGSRSWADGETIEQRLREFPAGTTVIHGGAQGADLTAAQIALKLGYHVSAYPAQWKKYGKRAGIVRNLQMLNLGKPDLVVAFWDGESPGTAHTIAEAHRRGIETEVIL